jgi:hypothetical protein
MERYKFDAASKTLTITAGYAKKLNDMDSDEFKHYNAMMEAIPGLVVVNRSHRSPSKCTSTATGEKFKCNQFKNLTYDNMERFIDALPHGKVYRQEYNFLRYYAACIQTNRYKLVRMWFVAQFPHFRKNPLFYVYNTPTVVKASEVIDQEADEAKQDDAA